MYYKVKGKALITGNVSHHNKLYGVRGAMVPIASFVVKGYVRITADVSIIAAKFYEVMISPLRTVGTRNRIFVV